MKPTFTRLRGMPDVLPQDMASWHLLESAVRRVMHCYAYGELRTPVMERAALFEQSIGEATDIVEKEMYTFPDRKGEHITLRPENTAGCLRAAIENGLLQPGSVNRIWYSGPMFRYERPQLGRQRQFNQTGAEVYGLAGPAIEAELISLGARLWNVLGINSAMQLEINTLGDPQDRVRYQAKLVDYFEQHKQLLDEDSVRRLTRNPLRILDSKNPAMQDLIKGAPLLNDSLSSESRVHFDQLRSLLAASSIDFTVNPRLVRGLDYYSHTVFEWTTDQLGAQSALCGGGRYDGLLAQMGAAGTPGAGWAFGMERVIALMDKLDSTPLTQALDIFVLSTDDTPKAEALALAEAVRNGLPHCSVLQNTAQGSMKSQFRKADKSGARLALILGTDELNDATVTIKPMRGGDQLTVSRDNMIEHLQTLLLA